jgi:Family of unknown function (DUF6152)
MNSFRVVALGIALIGALATGFTSVHAHHSHAMFDGSKEVLLEGTVTAVRFANPHVYLQMRVSKKDGVALEPAATWAIEMSTVQNQTQRGLTPTVLTPGSAIAVKVNPLFSGQPSGNYTNVVHINGVKNTSNGQDWKPAGA